MLILKKSAFWSGIFIEKRENLFVFQNEVFIFAVE